MPSTQSLSNWSLASDPGRQFCDQMFFAISSNNIVQQKRADWHSRAQPLGCGTVRLISIAKGAPRSCPAGCIAEVGLRWQRRDAAKPNGGSF